MNHTDKELLEKAAKAIGLKVLCYETKRNCLRIGERGNYSLWRPLSDDGDALRLAVKLKIDMLFSPVDVFVFAPDVKAIAVDYENDAQSKVRMAIVKAASSIWDMKKDIQ